MDKINTNTPEQLELIRLENKVRYLEQAIVLITKIASDYNPNKIPHSGYGQIFILANEINAKAFFDQKTLL